MPSYRLTPPTLRWGTNLANALYLPFPLDNVVTYEEPRAGSEFIQSVSGNEDAWYAGTDYTLEGDHRWVPQVDSLYYPRATGWDGTFGVRAALNWLRQKNPFSWHPDGRNLLRLPLLNSAGAATLNGDGGWKTFQSAGGLTGVTNAFDGVETAWKVAATNPTGGSISIGIFQTFPAIVGEQLYLSTEYKAASLVSGAIGQAQINLVNSVPAEFSTIDLLSPLTSTTYQRPGSGAGATTSAGTVFGRVYLLLTLPAAASGIIWFRNVMVRRDSTDTTFVDNPSVDTCYLVDPILSTPPTSETDGSRKLRLKLRNAATPYDGY